MTSKNDMEDGTVRLRDQSTFRVALLDGQMALLLDPLVLGITNELERVLAENDTFLQTDKAQIELEGRLGRLMEGDEQFNVPVRSECVILRSYLYKFSPGLTSSNYEKVTNHLASKLKDKVTSVETDDRFVETCWSVLEKCGLKLDETAQTQPPSVRISYKAGSDIVLEMIHKAHHTVLDIHTGATPDDAESGDKIRTDMRIAINVEHRLNGPSIFGKTELTRKRSRKSYAVSGRVHIDATEVSANATKTHEIEVEANGELLLKELIKKRKGEEHQVYFIVHEFLAVLRSLAAYVNRTDAHRKGGNQPCELAFLKDVAPSAEQLDLYQQFVSPVVPVIGDYLYRAVAVDRAATQQPLTADEIELSRRLCLTPKETSILQRNRG